METWKEIQGYPNYFVSDLGNVKTIDRKDTIGRFVKGRILSAGLSNRYLYVSLRNNMKSRSFMVHQLVAQEFLGHKINGMKSVIDHLDNNPLNNKKDNLEIVTQRENCTRYVKTKKTSSKYVGVHWSNYNQKWVAQITINNKRKTLGYFNNEKEAFNSYLKAKENVE